MRVPPEKPHFFQHILTGFKNGIMIPESLFNFLIGMKCERAVLKRGCKTWDVKINGRHFEDGWRKFAEDNDLQVGDFLVFSHEENTVFKVMVFDPIRCEKEHMHRACDVGEVESIKAKERILEKSSEKFEFGRSDEISRGKQSMKLSGERVSEHAHPNFLTTLNPSNFRYRRMNIPLSFAKLNGLCNRKCKMILKDQRQRSWSVVLSSSSEHVQIRQGWREFCLENGLREGNHLLCELIDNGQTPVMKIYDLEGNQSAPVTRVGTKRSSSTLDEGSKKKPPPTNLEGKSARFTDADGSGQEKKQPVTHLETKRAFFQNIQLEKPSEKLKFNGSDEISRGKKSTKVAGERTSEHSHPCFVTTLKQSNFRHCRMNIPMSFAKLNGLCNRKCTMILKDQKQRSWSVLLSYSDDHVSIGKGWREFHIGNGLREGDCLLFELIDSGQMPVMNIYEFEGNQSEPCIGTKKSSSTLEEVSNIKDKPSLTFLQGKSSRSTLVTPDQESKQPVTRLEVKSRFSSDSDHPYFVSTVKPCKWPYLSIPMEFARSNGLNKHCCEVIVIDSNERSWPVELVPMATQVIIRRGWGKFFNEKGLKEGDSFKLELINKGDKPIMKFHELGRMPKMTHLADMNASSLSSDYPYFVSTIKAYSIRKRELYLPMEFAKQNGLIKKSGEMILRDDQHRSWSVRLRHDGTHFSIGSGWYNFCISNGLKEGDSYKFELVQTGETPIANFTLVSGNTSENGGPGNGNENEGMDQ